MEYYNVEISTKSNNYISCIMSGESLTDILNQLKKRITDNYDNHDAYLQRPTDERDENCPSMVAFTIKEVDTVVYTRIEE